jgi:hypothetical protein
LSRASRAIAICAFAVAAPVLFPAAALAQTPAASQPAQPIVVVLPFTGNATQDLLDDATAVVRNALLARGARVPDRAAVTTMLGVDAPRDAQSIAGFGRTMGATQVVSGAVRPLSGQYDLTLTLTEVATGRQATRQNNVGGDNPGEAVAVMVAALFDPAALGPAPVDPEEARRRAEAEQRRAEEERARAEAQRRAEAERQRREADARQRAFETANPARTYSDGGPFALGVGLQLGGLVSATRAAPVMPRPGAQLSDPSSLALMLRVEGAYALRAVTGLEVAGALMLMTSPSTALSLGVGPQFTFPAVSRGRFRGTGGVLIGLFQGLSGARITTLWLEPYVRAQYDFTPSVAATAGVAFDVAPGDNGGVLALSVTAGVRVRLGN